MKKLTDLIATLIGIGFCAFLVIGIGVCSEATGFNPRFVIAMVSVFSVPTLLSFLSFLVSVVIKPNRRSKLTVEQILYQENTYPLYLETVNYFKIALQNRILTRAEVLEFKRMLNQALSGHLKQYQQHFENDAHEIYTKLKSHHISQSDMEALRDYIMPYALSASVSSISNSPKEQPQKTYGHLRVVK